MKTLLTFFMMMILNMNFVCKTNNVSPDILNGLNKSYILNKSEYEKADDFFQEYKVDYSTFKKDSLEYYRSVQILISSNTSIIEQLLSFEGNRQPCYWIKTIKPYSSTINPDDLFEKAIAAKILVDNYILNSEKIVIRPYIQKIEYSWLKSWYKKDQDRENLKADYLRHIQKL